MIWGHYYPHQPIHLITELTGFKPVSLLSLSHIPHGQCLQKLTERFPLRLVLKLTSAIPFLSSWSEGQRREAHTHTHTGISGGAVKLHSPHSALLWELCITSGTTDSQETASTAAGQLTIATGVTGQTQAAGTEALWAMTDVMQKLKVLLPSLSFPKPFFSPSAGGGKTNVVCVPQPRASAPQTVPVNPTLCNYSQWWRCSSQDTEGN